jgi:hypothetical protein
MPHINHHRGETRRSVNREVGCSCSMCGNPRRNGWDNSPTRQELKIALEDVAPRARARAKKGPKPYTIEKRRISREGDTGKWWTELKSYRTLKARDSALEALRKSARCYGWSYYRTRTVSYTGPMDEFRVGPNK